VVSSNLLRRIRLTAFILIAVLAGFYASLLLRTAPEPDAASALEVTDGEVIEPALTLPEFVLADMTGQMRSIEEFTGQPLLINFWATWCAPCLREMPMLETVWQERNKGNSLQIVGIAIDRAEEVDLYLNKTDVTYPILIGQSDAMEAAGSFGPDFAGLPFTVFISADRQILLSHSGELQREQFDDIMSIIDAVSAGQLSIADARTRLLR
jgi:thiol-disulfide isomerase/thioredoxin